VENRLIGSPSRPRIFFINGAKWLSFHTLHFAANTSSEHTLENPNATLTTDLVWAFNDRRPKECEVLRILLKRLSKKIPNDVFRGISSSKERMKAARSRPVPDRSGRCPEAGEDQKVEPEGARSASAVTHNGTPRHRKKRASDSPLSRT
jgi:hypothetical protein